MLDTRARFCLWWAIIPTGLQRCPKSTEMEAPSLRPSSDSSQTVPFADTVTIAKVVGTLAARNKQVIIRRGNSSSFSDLSNGAVVLIGAFNNEWSLRLTRQLRYSLAMDPDHHVIYIRDAKNPSSRSWSWGTNQPREPITGANSPRLEDFALSRGSGTRRPGMLWWSSAVSIPMAPRRLASFSPIRVLRGHFKR